MSHEIIDWCAGSLQVAIDCGAKVIAYDGYRLFCRIRDALWKGNDRNRCFNEHC